jgi:hypothetical protein
MLQKIWFVFFFLTKKTQNYLTRLYSYDLLCGCQVQNYIYWIISTENDHRHHHKFIKYEKRLRKEGNMPRLTYQAKSLPLQHEFGCVALPVMLQKIRFLFFFLTKKDQKLSLSELLSRMTSIQFNPTLFIWPSMTTRLDHAHCLETINNMCANLVQHPDPQTGKITTINMITWYNTLTHKQAKLLQFVPTVQLIP